MYGNNSSYKIIRFKSLYHFNILLAKTMAVYHKPYLSPQSSFIRHNQKVNIHWLTQSSNLRQIHNLTHISVSCS